MTLTKMEQQYIEADKSDPYTAGRIQCHKDNGIVGVSDEGKAAEYEANTFRTKGLTTMGQALVKAGLVKNAVVPLVGHKNMMRP